MFPITQEAEIWNISSLDMYPAPHKISERALTILFMSKKNTCFLSINGVNMTKFAPPNSYIDLKDFKNIEGI